MSMFMNLKEQERMKYFLIGCERDHDVSCYANITVLNGEQ